jgi:hypothetical protein
VGFRFPSTLAKQAAREAARQKITSRIGEILDAQINSAIGIAHFMLRDPVTGEWRRVTSARAIEKALNDPRAKAGSTFFIYTKDPNTQAAREMLAYAIDRPSEPATEARDQNVAELVGLLQAARQRAQLAQRGAVGPVVDAPAVDAPALPPAAEKGR